MADVLLILYMKQQKTVIFQKYAFAQLLESEKAIWELSALFAWAEVLMTKPTAAEFQTQRGEVWPFWIDFVSRAF